MKNTKYIVTGILAFAISASLFIGYYLAIDLNQTEEKRLRKENAELFELLKEQTALNDIHSATIENLNYQLEQYFDNINKQFDYNEELNHK